MDKYSIKIDWEWVWSELVRIERIPERNNIDSNNSIYSCAEDCFMKIRDIATPEDTSMEKEIFDLLPGSIGIGGGITFNSGSLSSYLKGAGKLRVFLVTIGGAAENMASLLMKEGDDLSGYLIDRLASLSVESLARNYEACMRNYYSDRGSSISMRLSPGYCDWNIEEQYKLDKALDFSGAGVILTESCMMIPRKSISGIIGIGPAGLFSGSRSQCIVCSKKDCDYRR